MHYMCEHGINWHQQGGRNDAPKLQEFVALLVKVLVYIMLRHLLHQPNHHSSAECLRLKLNCKNVHTQVTY